MIDEHGKLRIVQPVDSFEPIVSIPSVRAGQHIASLVGRLMQQHADAVALEFDPNWEAIQVAGFAAR